MYRTAADDPTRPFDLGDERALTQRMIDGGQLLCGTADQVGEQLREVAGVYGGGALDWLIYETWGQALPDDEGSDIHRDQLNTYATEVMPTFQLAHPRRPDSVLTGRPNGAAMTSTTRRRNTSDGSTRYHDDVRGTQRISPRAHPQL